MFGMFKKKQIVKNTKKRENIVVKELPYHVIYEKFVNDYLTFYKKEKVFTLILLKYTEKSGSPLRTGIVNKIKESRRKKKFMMEYILLKILYYMDIKGHKIVEAMYLAKFITEKERSILMKARSIEEGIDQIANLEKRTSKLLVYNFLLLFPAYAMLLTLYLTHGLVKDVLEGMVKPIKDAGGTPPPLPNYMVDPQMYLTFNIMFFSLLFIVLAFYYYIKYYNLPLYFKIFLFNEQEKTLDVLESVSSLINSGINLTDTAEILYKDEKDPVKRVLYGEIFKSFSKGDISLSQVFEFYNVNYSTISLISMGEDTGKIQDGLFNAKNNVNETYELNMKVYSKIAFYGGQLLMFLVIGKPMIDILLFTSIQQLNFST